MGVMGGLEGVQGPESQTRVTAGNGLWNLGAGARRREAAESHQKGL